ETVPAALPHASQRPERSKEGARSISVSRPRLTRSLSPSKRLMPRSAPVLSPRAAQRVWFGPIAAGVYGNGLKVSFVASRFFSWYCLPFVVNASRTPLEAKWFIAHVAGLVEPVCQEVSPVE